MLPSDVGQRQPLYFFLLPAYWKPNQAIKASASAEEAPDSPLMGSTGATSLSLQADQRFSARATSCMWSLGAYASVTRDEQPGQPSIVACLLVLRHCNQLSCMSAVQHFERSVQPKIIGVPSDIEASLQNQLYVSGPAL